MEFEDHCEWYMIKVGDSYGIQYCGPEPAVAFPLHWRVPRSGFGKLRVCRDGLVKIGENHQRIMARGYKVTLCLTTLADLLLTIQHSMPRLLGRGSPPNLGRSQVMQTLERMGRIEQDLLIARRFRWSRI